MRFCTPKTFKKEMSTEPKHMKNFFLSLAIIMGFLQTTIQPAFVQISQSEREALIAFYNSTGGANWNDNTGWIGVRGTECDWYGVTCDRELQSVQILNLNLNNLTGSIPKKIGNLKQLKRLSLDINYLTGTIPSEIGNLTQLKYLNLARNQLTGSIPSEIGNLTQLRVIHLVGNQLTGRIPSQIGNLTLLKHFYLNENQLTGNIPPEIGNLTQLLGFWAYDNKLNGSIPSEIGNLGKLLHLSLPYNQLTGLIPVEMMNLPIVYLDFCGNYLYANDPGLIAFLYSVDGMLDWEDCQLY